MKPHFLLAQRAPVEGYPPVLHQARILAAIGDVTILDAAAADAYPFQTSGAIRRRRISPPPTSGSPGRLHRLQSAMAFGRAFARELARKPDVVIAFEPEAGAFLLGGNRAGESLKIVHLHEHPIIATYSQGAMARWSVNRALARMHLADAVVVADDHRASELKGMARLDSEPLVVMNCPPLLERIPDSKLIPAMRARGLTGPIVHYHGSVGPDHGLETAIRSMRSWPADSSFSVVGAGSAEYVRSLEQLATENGVEGRVVFLGAVPYDEVFSYVAGATVGLSLLDTDKPNWRFAAGASNKRFEYMALGVPQVANTGPGMTELFGDAGVALLADPHDPESVATAVNAYLSSEELRAATTAKSRALHLGSCNYERQFEPVVEHIRRHLDSRKPIRSASRSEGRQASRRRGS